MRLYRKGDKNWSAAKKKVRQLFYSHCTKENGTLIAIDPEWFRIALAEAESIFISDKGGFLLFDESKGDEPDHGLYIILVCSLTDGGSLIREVQKYAVENRYRYVGLRTSAEKLFTIYQSKYGFSRKFVPQKKQFKLSARGKGNYKVLDREKDGVVDWWLTWKVPQKKASRPP